MRSPVWWCSRIISSARSAIIILAVKRASFRVWSNSGGICEAFVDESTLTRDVEMHTTSEMSTGVAAFLAKLWKMVEDPKTNEFISWSPVSTFLFTCPLAASPSQRASRKITHCVITHVDRRRGSRRPARLRRRAATALTITALMQLRQQFYWQQ